MPKANEINYDNIFQVFDGQEGSSHIQEYKDLIEKNKFSTATVVQLMRKLDEVVDTCNKIGQQLMYKFRSYAPGFVAVDPYFFYFNEEEDLKDFLHYRNPRFEKDRIEIGWNKSDKNEHYVYSLSREDKDKKYIIGFITETNGFVR